MLAGIDKANRMRVCNAAMPDRPKNLQRECQLVQIADVQVVMVQTMGGHLKEIVARFQLFSLISCHGVPVLSPLAVLRHGGRTVLIAAAVTIAPRGRATARLPICSVSVFRRARDGASGGVERKPRILLRIADRLLRAPDQ